LVGVIGMEWVSGVGLLHFKGDAGDDGDVVMLRGLLSAAGSFLLRFVLSCCSERVVRSS
jgi:hypothetical protein